MSERRDQSKSVALEWCKGIHEKKFDVIARLFAPDAKWQVMVNGPSPPWPGTKPAAEACASTAQIVGSFEEWKFTVLSVVAEEDVAVVEALSHGRGPGTQAYNNTYMLKFELEGGKIKLLKEYVDALSVESWLKTREGVDFGA